MNDLVDSLVDAFICLFCLVYVVYRLVDVQTLLVDAVVDTFICVF
jgi:hypothetical protein